MDVRPEESDISRAREGRLAGEALVDHAAERVDVGTLVQGVARDLLGRDVFERAHDLPCDRDSGERARALRQAEVAEVAVLTSRRTRDEDVRRLHVTVDEALLVSRVEGLRDLQEEVDRAFRLECSILATTFARSEPST